MYNFDDQSSTDPLLLWLVHFIALLQKRHFLPDAALVLLLRFFAIFINILSGISPQLTSFSQQFPPSLYKFHKLLGARQEEAFVRYVVCPICSMVYNYDDCLERNGTQTVALNCKYRFSGRQSPCNGVLLRCMELSSKKKVFYPNRVFLLYASKVLFEKVR